MNFQANSACKQLFFFFPLGSHLREDEEEGGRADQEAGGRAHRDEGAGFQWVGAAGGHPVLSALIRVPFLTKTTANTARKCRFVCVSSRTKPFINVRALENENQSNERGRRRRRKENLQQQRQQQQHRSLLSVPAGSSAQMPPPVYPKGGAFNLVVNHVKHYRPHAVSSLSLFKNTNVAAAI